MKAYKAFALILTLILGQSMTARCADGEDAPESETVVEETVAEEDAESTDPVIEASVTPYGRMYWVDGNESHFREVMWLGDDWDAGAELRLRNPENASLLYEVEAKASYGWDDFDLMMRVADPDSGFSMRGGFEQYHKYFGDQGGYYQPFDPDSYRQDKDLELTIGSYWFEVEYADPKGRFGVLLGYRGSYKKGDKSTTEFNNAGGNKYIAPGYKDIDEETQTIYLELSATVAGVKLRNRTTYETWDAENLQVVVFNGEGRRREEDASYDMISNALTFERWITDWFLLSGGYLYAETDGDAFVDLQYVPYPVGSSRRYLTDFVDFDSRSNVANLNALLGPFHDLTLVLGLQAEYTEYDADALVYDLAASGGVPPAMPGEHDLQSSTDLFKLRETAELAYAGIPHTKVYLRGEWEQADYDLHERELEDGLQVLYRQTDTNRDRQSYRAGFTTRVLAPVTIGGYYQKKYVDNDYENNRDEEEPGVPLDGYSAFLEELNFETDEVSLRISSPITRWLHLSARYLYVGTEIENQVDASAPVPNGSGTSSDYDSHTGSVNAVVSPNDKLYFTVGSSYRVTRSRSPAIDSAALTRYYSETWTVNGSANYAYSDTTTFYGSFYVANSDSDESKTVTTRLPVGVDYDSQTYILGASHRFCPSVIGKLEGLYSVYDDENYGGERGSFEAIGLMLSLNITF